jgi:hypothetical protein
MAAIHLTAGGETMKDTDTGTQVYDDEELPDASSPPPSSQTPTQELAELPDAPDPGGQAERRDASDKDTLDTDALAVAAALQQDAFPPKDDGPARDLEEAGEALKQAIKEHRWTHGYVLAAARTSRLRLKGCAGALARGEFSTKVQDTITATRRKEHFERYDRAHPDK